MKLNELLKEVKNYERKIRELDEKKIKEIDKIRKFIDNNLDTEELKTLQAEDLHGVRFLLCWKIGMFSDTEKKINQILKNKL